MKRKLGFIFILLIMLQAIYVVPLYAKSHDYTVISGERIPIPLSYTHSKTIYNGGDLGTESGYLKEPQDLYINNQGYLYVADTGNNRIVKLSPDGKTAGIYKGDPAKPFRGPSGIFADNAGDMYVADTNNSRIVHLSPEGEFIEQFEKPDSDLLRATVTFSPSKLLVSPSGYIYTLRGQNIMTMDAYNRFRGFLGQSEIGHSLMDSLIRKFATEEQLKKIAGRLASAYTNITMDEKGILYATSLDSGKEIKKLNAVGKNIYRAGTFGETFDFETNTPMVPNLVDIAVDRDGIITVLDGTVGKLYQYDQEANLLAVFGGLGEQQGQFTAPSSIANDDQGNIYVLDRLQGSIDIFEPTSFIKLVHQSIRMYNIGEYDQAYQLWAQVLVINENYKLAHSGLAKALYKKGDWKAAMEEYKLADDRTGYSQAFAEHRYDVFRKYFVVMVVLLILAIVCLMWIINRLKRLFEIADRDFSTNSDKIGVMTGFLMSIGVIFQPIRTFEKIVQARGRLNYTSGWIILIAVLFIRLFYLLNVHYPFENVDLLDSNLWMEAVKLLLPPLTWIIASFFISAILDGESKISEIFVATCYCMVPYLLVIGPLALLSNVLTLNESSLYDFVYSGIWIWILALFFLSLRSMNDYTFIRTSIVYSVSGLTMILMWFVGLLGYVLTGQLYQFVDGIAKEVRMTWL